MRTFELPDLGEGLQEAEIVAWHVEEGQRIAADQPLLSVETDKAVVEIPAPYAGIIAKLHGKIGDIIKVGAALVEFGESERVDAGTVVGALPSEPVRFNDVAGERGNRARVKVTPAVRALARKLNVDLATVDATGPEGLITREDVERVAASLATLDAPEPLRGVRRAMAQKMALSHSEVVPASVHDEADVEDWAPGTDITTRMVRAIVAACRAEPSLNTWFDAGTMSRRLMKKIDLGIAVATEDGLFVPVLRDVGNRDADDLRRGLDAMKHDVEARAIPIEELRGATITLSNFGMFKVGRFAQMVVIPPQVAIVGCGPVAPRLVAFEGKPAVRRTLPLSLTFDHRVVTGAEATGFLAAMIGDLGKAG